MRERLFHEGVLAGLEATAAKLVVRENRRGEQDAVEVRIVQDLIKVSRQPHTGVAPPVALEPGYVGVTDPPQFDVRALDQHADEIRAPIAQAHYRDRWINPKAPHGSLYVRA